MLKIPRLLKLLKCLRLTIIENASLQDHIYENRLNTKMAAHIEELPTKLTLNKGMSYSSN